MSTFEKLDEMKNKELSKKQIKQAHKEVRQEKSKQQQKSR